jgi:hypothetical protein
MSRESASFLFFLCFLADGIIVAGWLKHYFSEPHPYWRFFEPHQLDALNVVRPLVDESHRFRQRQVDDAARNDDAVAGITQQRFTEWAVGV